jgi:hypothetical protein
MPRIRRSWTLVVAIVVLGAILVPAVAEGEPGFTTVQTLPGVIGTTPRTAGAYGSISCPSSTSCTAVGPSVGQTVGYSSDAGRPTALTETNGVWGAPVPLPVPLGASRYFLDSVACPSLGNCVAVGGFLISATKQAHLLVEIETSGLWALTSITPPADAGSNAEFFTVSCASMGNCQALGVYETTSKTIATVLAVESSGSWAQATALSNGAAGAGAIILPESMTCTDASDCLAIGYGFASQNTQFVSTFAWTETAGVWGAAVRLPEQLGHEFAGFDVACPSASSCFVGGGDITGTDRPTQPAMSVEASGVWTTPRPIGLPRLAPLASGGFIASLACPTSTMCEAVGTLSLPSSCRGNLSVCLTISAGSLASRVASASFFHLSRGARTTVTLGISGSEPFAISWDGTRWSSPGVIHRVTVGPRHATSSALATVACTSAAGCLGLGFNSVVVGSTVRSSAFAASLIPVRATSVPLPPSAVTATARVRGAFISWVPPNDDGGAPVQTFTATIEPGDRHCMTSRYFCKFGGLRDGHRYRVVVRDSTAAGTSGPKLSGRFTVGAVPSVPRRFRASVKHGEVKFTWLASGSSTGERITSYKVTMFSLERLTVRVCHSVAAHCTYGNVNRGIYIANVVAVDASGVSGVASTLVLV